MSEEQSTLGEAARRFVEDFADNWHESGAGRMEGRVMGYLLITTSDHVSSAELSRELGIASGAVSMATRALGDQGYIRRRRLPGDRSHYFEAHEDIWGGFLTSERRWVFRMESVLDEANQQLDLEGAARRRVLIAREYMRWLGDYNQQMFRDWRAHLAAHTEALGEEPLDPADEETP
ncbi:GbsR/MarR family transcriptional regulator [Nocardioides flavescens]|uniref:MarR family transcriptional regulator n=1 Tax=Nocardioides flavescens TaxID=2691959 RepID=A0A6L7EZW8_9ACTN|nr:MarR family transcriptional regulator [Nocardioides flavescens]MXG89561.1 MarR family transcriptional regulator [Nocardioides flavescens]